VAIGKANSNTDCPKYRRNCRYVSVSQLKLGFCVSQYWNHPAETGKATGPVVPFEVVVAASPNRLVPGSSPYQRCLPSTTGPSWLTAPA